MARPPPAPLLLLLCSAPHHKAAGGAPEGMGSAPGAARGHVEGREEAKSPKKAIKATGTEPEMINKGALGVAVPESGPAAGPVPGGIPLSTVPASRGAPSWLLAPYLQPQNDGFWGSFSPQTNCLQYLDARNTPLLDHSAPFVARALRISSSLVVLHLENASLSGRPLMLLGEWRPPQKPGDPAGGAGRRVEAAARSLS